MVIGRIGPLLVGTNVINILGTTLDQLTQYYLSLGLSKRNAIEKRKFRKQYTILSMIDRTTSFKYVAVFFTPNGRPRFLPSDGARKKW